MLYITLTLVRAKIHQTAKSSHFGRDNQKKYRYRTNQSPAITQISHIPKKSPMRVNLSEDFNPDNAGLAVIFFTSIANQELI